MNIDKNKLRIFTITIVVAGMVFLCFKIVSAAVWQEPGVGCNPPDCNIAPPVYKKVNPQEGPLNIKEDITAGSGKIEANEMCICSGDNCAEEDCIDGWNDVSGLWTKTVNDIYYDNGNVGIGTSAPTADLEVKSKIAGGGAQIRIQNDGTALGNTELILRRNDGDQVIIRNTPGGGGLSISQNHETGNIKFLTGSSLYERMRILANGNVGIGTITPSEKLEINDTTTGTARLRITDTEQNPELQLQYGAGGSDHWAMYNNQGDDALRIWGGGADRLTILQNGNVGIGTSVPGSKLDVRGDLEVRESSLSYKAVKHITFSGVDFKHKYILLARVPTFGAATYNAGISGNITAERVNMLGMSVDENIYLRIGYNNTVYYNQSDYGNNSFQLVKYTYNSVDYLALYAYTAPNWSKGIFDGVVNNQGGWLDSNFLKVIEVDAANHSVASYLKSNTSLTGGNVGIGITAPSEKLEVAGNVSAAKFIGDGSGLINLNISQNSLDAADGNPADAVYVDNDGNVGVGTTAPSSTFHIISNNANPLIVQRSSNDNSNIEYRNNQGVMYAGLNPSENFGIGPSLDLSNAPFIVTNTGKVGIGATIPAEKLEIGDTTADTARLRISDTAQNPELQLQYGAGGADHWAMYNNQSDDALRVWGGGSDRLTILQNGNVGIGIVKPDAPMHIVGVNDKESPTVPAQLMISDSGDTTQRLQFGYEDTWDVGVISVVDFGTSWKNLSLQPHGGNVGIGTTAPGAKLDVNGNIYTSTGILTNGVFGSGGDGGVAENIWIGDSNDTIQVRGTLNVTGDITGASVGGWTKNGNNLYATDVNDKVGIGTTAPSEKLEVAGNVSAAKFIGDGSGLINLNISQNSLDAADGNPADVVYVDNDGNVGIGTTAPTHKLSIYDSGSNGILLDAASIPVQRFSRAGTNKWGFLVNHESADAFGIFDYTRNDYALLMKPNGNSYFKNGNVGIGSVAPAEKLEINDTTAGTARLRITDIAQNPELQLQYGAGGGDHWAMYNNQGDDALRIWGGGADRLTVLQNGNIGIGTTAPSAKLDVYGDLRINTNDAINKRHIFTISRAIGTGAGSWVNLGSVVSNSKGAYVTIYQSNHNSGSINSAVYQITDVYYAGATTDWMQVPTVNYRSYSGVQDYAIDVRRTATHPTANLEIRARVLNASPGAGTLDFEIQTNGSFVSSSSSGTGASVAGFLGNNAYQFPVSNNRFKATADGLFILNNGNVGIGATAPAARLQVNPSANVEGVRIISSNFSPFIIRNTADDADIFRVDQYGNLTITGNIIGGSIGGWTKSENKIYATDINDKVGIGTAAPADKLHVYNGASNGTANASYDDLVVETSGAGGITMLGGNASNLGIFFGDAELGDQAGIIYNNSTDAMTFKVAGLGVTTILQNGNVGIGTNNPLSKLDIHGGVGGTSLRIGNNAGTGDTTLDFYGQNAAAFPVYANIAMKVLAGGIGSESGDLAFSTINAGTFTEKMRVKNNGNVGIGTTAPSAKLDVNGSTNISGNLNVGGTFNAGGADLAEEFITEGDIEEGTVLIMGDNGYKSAKPCESEYDIKVIGVVSDNAAVIMGKVESEHKAVIAISGVVTVKVSIKNGIINKGDLLTTSSMEGYAMKATDAKIGTVIGKALENCINEKCRIKALINLQ